MLKTTPIQGDFGVRIEGFLRRWVGTGDVPVVVRLSIHRIGDRLRRFGGVKRSWELRRARLDTSQGRPVRHGPYLRFNEPSFSRMKARTFSPIPRICSHSSA